MGGSGIVCVTTCVCGVMVRMMRFVVTTRRTRFTGLRAAWRLRTTFLPTHGEQDWTVWARAFGTSAICIAPLPMIAPPQVQAQSLARAIRTDIGFSFFPVAGAKRHRPAPPVTLRYNSKGQSFVNAAIVLTAFACPRAGIGTRNQQKSRYLSQNRTHYAAILCNWLTFGPKSPLREPLSPVTIKPIESLLSLRRFIAASRRVAIGSLGACIVASGWV